MGESLTIGVKRVSMRQIPLTRNLVALVDDEDFERLSQFTWYAKPSGKRGNYYAYRSVGCYENYRKIIMHREILPPPQGYFIDHINGNGLDNQKANLRVCTMSENMHNRVKNKNNKSGYKGVCAVKGLRDRQWITQIVVGGKKIRVGYYNDLLEAAHAYDEAAYKYFGEFANVNFPRDWGDKNV